MLGSSLDTTSRIESAPSVRWVPGIGMDASDGQTRETLEPVQKSLRGARHGPIPKPRSREPDRTGPEPLADEGHAISPESGEVSLRPGSPKVGTSTPMALA